MTLKSILIPPLLLVASFGQGQTWDNLSWDDLEWNHSSFIHKMTYIKGDLWAVDYGGGRMFKSENEGESWEKSTKLGSEYFEQLQFIDHKIGLVAGDYGFVYKTENGGETWEEISPEIEDRIKTKYRNDSTMNQHPNGRFVAYYGMHFTDKLKGFVSGFDFNPSTGYQDSFRQLMFETHDGGKSWEQIPLENQGLKTKEYLNEGTVQKSSFPGYWIFDNQIVRLRRDDHQNDVFQFKALNTEEWQTSQLPKTDFRRIMLRSIIFYNDSIGYILGGSLDEGNQKAVIFKTGDGGVSWNPLATTWPHIHTAITNGQYTWISGKEGLLKRIPNSELQK